jgi:hypothetical protein
MDAALRRALAAALLAAALAAPAARAAALPFVEGFDDANSIFGWVSTVGGVTVGWSDLDATGSPSGSALLTNQRGDSASGPVHTALDCFPVAEGVPYTIEASILIPAGQAATGVAQMFVSWYASPACGALAFLDWGRSPDVRSAGSWQRVSDDALAAPAGALGARVGMVLFKNEAAGALQAHFDDLRFAPEPGGGAPALAACAALAYAARRRAASAARPPASSAAVAGSGTGTPLKARLTPSL